MESVGGSSSSAMVSVTSDGFPTSPVAVPETVTDLSGASRLLLDAVIVHRPGARRLPRRDGQRPRARQREVTRHRRGHRRRRHRDRRRGARRLIQRRRHRRNPGVLRNRGGREDQRRIRRRRFKRNPLGHANAEIPPRKSDDDPAVVDHGLGRNEIRHCQTVSDERIFSYPPECLTPGSRWVRRHHPRPGTSLDPSVTPETTCTSSVDCDRLLKHQLAYEARRGRSHPESRYCPPSICLRARRRLGERPRRESRDHHQQQENGPRRDARRASSSPGESPPMRAGERP